MYDLIIIGGGIAGETAAIYAARKKMNFRLVTKMLGGQFLESGEILNYPGIVKTNGEKFSDTMEEQLEFNDIEPVEGVTVTAIKQADSNFKIESDKEEFEAKSVIIATGARPKKLGVPGEEEFVNKGVGYCSICDGPLFADQDVAVIGGGNSALEGAEFIKDIAKKIYIINIEKEFNAHEYLIDKIGSRENVEIITEARTTEIFGDKMVKGLRYEKNGETKELNVTGIIIEIGRTPNTEFVKDFVDLDKEQHIKIDCQTRTSVKGIFAAGDCASGHEYQYVIAAGQGCMALLKASRYLAEFKD